jgi:hypothetical protein
MSGPLWKYLDIFVLFINRVLTFIVNNYKKNVKCIKYINLKILRVV